MFFSLKLLESYQSALSPIFPLLKHCAIPLFWEAINLHFSLCMPQIQMKTRLLFLYFFSISGFRSLPLHLISVKSVFLTALVFEQCLSQVPQTHFAIVVALMKFLDFISRAHQLNCFGRFPEYSLPSMPVIANLFF